MRVTGKVSGNSRSRSSSQGQIIPARVRGIILDDTTYPDSFDRLGGWSSIGTIFWNSITSPSSNLNDTEQTYAKPLFPNEKKYPLVNEIVYIISLPNSDNATRPNSTTFYYFNPINIWTNNHHNAIPNPFENTLPPSQQQDYQQTEAGIVRRVTDGSTEIDLGNTFSERLDVRNLQPFEGDLIYQGRWGQTIRFGSTVKESKIPNTWSKSGEDGDPITIIKNGQHEEDKEPWIPQVEDINEDKSSIYLTTTQEIPIDVASKNYKSYESSPTATPLFNEEQIILNSGRLLFNSKSDSILLSSFDTINLNAINSVNIDTPKTIVSSPEIYLGDKNATEPIILGDKFLDDFQKLLTSVIKLGNALATPIGTPTPFVPNAAIPAPATETVVKAQRMLNKIQQYKSKVSKSK